VKEREKKVGLLRSVVRQTKGHRLSLSAIFALEILSTPLALLMPIAVKIAVDNVVGSQPVPRAIAALLPARVLHSRGRLLIAAAILQVLVVLLIQAHAFASYILKMRSGERMVLGFRTGLFRHLQRLPLAYHDGRGTSDSTFRVQDDAPALKSLTIDGALFLFSDVVKLFAMAWVTLLIDWRLALVALSVTPLLVLYAVVYQKKVGGRYKEVKRLESSAMQIVQEVLSAVRVVKAFGREESEERRFLDRSLEGEKARVRLAFADSTFGFAVNMTTAAGMALVLFVGIGNVMTNTLLLGSLLMVLTYLAQLYTPLQNITYHVASLQASGASADRAFEVLAEERENGSQANATTRDELRQRVAGSVEFRNVSFAYDAARSVLHDLSVNIPAGTRVGLVGRTGSGKTTFVNMLVRFYEPTTGQILLDGVDLREYPLDFLRSQFALVLQEPVLFSTTIAKNIAYGCPHASDAQIVEAARAANAHDFIQSLPKGYQTEAGERGILLSGGERQRISMARAFLKDAPILILDEPTSALDARTEGDILGTMRRLMMGRTSFFISHRLNALSHCDLLLKIDNSRAAEMAVPGSVAEIETLVSGEPDAEAELA